MDTKTEYARRIEERKIIKREIKKTLIFALFLLGLSFIYGIIAYFIKVEPQLTGDSLEKIYGGVNLFIVMLMIIILAVRKSIYYSPRLIREDFSITQVLKKWRVIDIILLSISEIIPICGLLMVFLGIPFDRNFHFFITSVLLIIILMPVGIKVRSKLSILRKHFPDI